MGFLSVIRGWALREKMPIREIARRTGLSRNTIKKYLREGAVEPKFKTPPRSSKLDPYADRLSAWLLSQTRKPRKERRSLKQMHEDLVKLGYDGSYGRVAAFSRAWRADRHIAEQTTGRGYRGHGVQTTAVYIAGQKRGMTPALRRDLRRRSAIELMIGHMKTDGRLSRCAQKGTLGDALHTVLCGCGHNIRMILAHLRALWAEILAVYYAMFGTKGGQIANQTVLRPLAA